MKYEITKNYKYNKEFLFQKIKKSWDRLGYTPSLALVAKDSSLPVCAFVRVFGKWSIALKEFCEWANNGADVENKKVSETIKISDDIEYKDSAEEEAEIEELLKEQNERERLEREEAERWVRERDELRRAKLEDTYF